MAHPQLSLERIGICAKGLCPGSQYNQANVYYAGYRTHYTWKRLSEEVKQTAYFLNHNTYERVWHSLWHKLQEVTDELSSEMWLNHLLQIQILSELMMYNQVGHPRKVASAKKPNIILF